MENNEKKIYEGGDRLLSWSFLEFEEKARTNTWYLWFGILSALFIAISLFVDNYLFAIIIILFDLIVFLQDWQKPRPIEFVITPQGVFVGDKLHKMRDISSFWIAYDPPFVTSIYFEFDSFFRPLLEVPLNSQNPLQVREILLKYIPENLEKEDEPFSDTFSKLFKL